MNFFSFWFSRITIIVANSALYARKLMHYSYAELEKYDNVEDEKKYNDVNPVDILQASYKKTISELELEVSF